jgi:ComF family protein
MGDLVSDGPMYTWAWRWVFSSRRLAQDRLAPATWIFQASSRLFASIFPDNCRICDEPLSGYSRAPICRKCLNAPKALNPEIFCLKCRTPFLRERALDDNGLCRLCAAGVGSYDAAYAWGGYDGVLKDLIHCFKFHGMRSLSKPLGGYLAEAFPRSERIDAIVPMPVHWTRRMERGFNQCELLASELSRHTGVPVWKSLRKVKRTEKQSNLAGAKRRRNVRGSFGVREGRSIAGKRLMLVDDVLTTGATVNEAAEELKRHGAARVAVLTVARVDRRGLLAQQGQFELYRATGEGSKR